MVEAFYDKINDYGSVTIKLASPEDIRSWSFGEVKKAETINYRTYRPEMDGLFCERIFGPERDWECPCGKYKGIKHKGIICDRCGVKVTHSRVRRKRMGHINLAAPVAHIWFFKSLPSRLGNLLAIKTSSLERVIYYVDYIVIDPGETPLKQNQLLTEEEYHSYKAQFGNKFEAGMGAEAIKKLLQRLDLDALSLQLRDDLKATRSKQKTKELASRLKTVEMLRESDNQPHWLCLDVIPVIPPELRPLVLLESGNFASSDLNDLYRRLINRNNRLKKLLELNAPEVIIRNEKRMLQQSVDALFDNARCKRSVVGTAKRPLKSLTDLIKGKQGRFRENLLGKRVDYSARSVIVVGPELKLNQCGIPKKIALELFQPFIIRKLKEIGAADTIKSAKKMLDRRDEQVWDILDEVIHEHPVLLNRAPTLHRMGIQAFEPVLVEGNAIKIHPLVCSGFNADFDGDQMAVHLPLSVEAQVEASTLMLSVNNIFSPASGRPVIAPSQDIVLGIYYLTTERAGEKGEGMRFSSFQEVFLAYATGKIGTHSLVYVRVDPDFEVVNAKGRRQALGWLVPDGKKGFTYERPAELDDIDPDRPAATILQTTVGRVILNDILDESMPFYNDTINKKANTVMIEECHRRCGRGGTLRFLDDLKELGFKASTRAGISFSKNDLRIPDEKPKILEETQNEVHSVESKFNKGLIAKDERTNLIIQLWMTARDELGKMMMSQLATDTRDGKPYLNPVYIMADSGARGSVDQIRQLAGMRGLMAKPSGDIIETPIKANFREGLRVLEYFSSTHGARKGLADTALKTADSGYLTRKLADVAQNVVINEIDCGTINGIEKQAVRRGAEVEVTLAEQLYGRTSGETIVDSDSGETVVEEGQLITRQIAAAIEDVGVDKVKVRSPLTCETPLGICATCYGADLSTGHSVEEGMAVGIIAAQSIGEPGTQLTMRTFHIGGVAESSQENERFFAPAAVSKQAQKGLKGTVAFENVDFIARSEVGEFDRAAFLGQSEIKKQTKAQRAKDKIVLSRNAVLVISYDTKVRGKTVEMQERVDIPLGALLKVDEGEEIKYGQKLAEWDPHNDPVLATAAGFVRFEDIQENQTMKIEDGRKVIIPHKGDKHPQIQVIRRDVEKLKVAAKFHHKKEGDIRRGTLIVTQPARGHKEGEAGEVESILFAPKGVRKDARDTLKGVLHLEGYDSRRLQLMDLRDFLETNDLKEYLGFGSTKTSLRYKVLLTDFKVEVHYLSGKTEKTEEYELPRGTLLCVDEGGKVAYDKEIAYHDPALDTILAASDGQLEFDNCKSKRDGSLVRLEPGDSSLRITQLLAYEPLVENAHITVEDGHDVHRGQLLAKVPTEMAKTQDITGGLPRVTEIFEARKPKNPSVLAELDGIIKLGKMRRNKQVIKIVSETGKIEMEHLVPQGKKVLINAEQRVEAGARLVAGPPVPHDILRISGIEALQDYLINEVQTVYRSQNVRIDDKHIEIIVSQMLRKVQIIDAGDTDFLPDEVVDKFRLQNVNRRYIDRGQKGAKFKPLLLGITKASLQSESFISAASFQETTKVLTAAALQGKRDMLLGLKENVILGHMIPAGTGFKAYLNGSVKKDLAAFDHLAKSDEKGLLEQ